MAFLVVALVGAAAAADGTYVAGAGAAAAACSVAEAYLAYAVAAEASFGVAGGATAASASAVGSLGAGVPFFYVVAGTVVAAGWVVSVVQT